MYYPVAVAGTYFIGRNMLFRGTSYAIDYILNSEANPDIKETHTVETIKAMLKSYKNLKPYHPAYESKRALQEALEDLQDCVDRARLKLTVHESGWLTRFRTFDARADNVQIEKKAKELMTRLEIFTKLIRLPSTKDYDEDEDDDDYEGDAEDTDTVADHKNVMPVTPTALALRYEFPIR